MTTRKKVLPANFDLAPITTVTMADQAELQLRHYFIKSGFKPGDALPKELELAQMLKVSRTIVREALSRLRMLGIVDSKKRRGMILTEPDILGGLSKIMEPNLFGPSSLNQLFELRLVIEIGLADLLFVKKTKEDIDRLTDIILQEDKYAHKRSEHVKYDIEFHGHLYEMTGNETLMRFQKLLVPIFHYALNAVIPQLPPAKQVGPVSHLDLVNILKKGNPEQFRNGMRRHLEPYFTIKK
jgi:GntR family transcriptional regulator, transcriptional repressor for pyruvate dehydrogenase complex